MDPSIDKTRKSADILKAELERKKRDLYKVYNPTNQPFQVILNKAISPEVWTIEAKEEAIVPAYVAEKYFEEMTARIIYIKSDKEIIAENEKRLEKGMPKMDLHTEQPRFESRNLKNLQGKQAQIVAVLNRGLYKEYGIDDQSISEPLKTRESKESFDPGEALGETRPPSPPDKPTEAIEVNITDVDAKVPETDEKPEVYISKATKAAQAEMDKQVATK